MLRRSAHKKNSLALLSISLTRSSATCGGGFASNRGLLNVARTRTAGRRCGGSCFWQRWLVAPHSPVAIHKAHKRRVLYLHPLKRPINLSKFGPGVNDSASRKIDVGTS